MTPIPILLTNDDGIFSPGLRAAAEALSVLGQVYVIAPRDQYSGAGRSLPSTSDGIITPYDVTIKGVPWMVYSVGGTPAQAVLHAIYEIMPERPRLAVSGINYGENPGTGITASGTVGAALEAASQDIPTLAISLETDPSHHLSHSTEVDFSAAAHFTGYFARLLLEQRMPPDVAVLKVDVPSDATTETPWELVRLTRQRYFESVAPQRTSWSERGPMGYRLGWDPTQDAPDTDASALLVRRVVAVTPLSLDLTSRVEFGELEKLLRA